MIGGVLGGLLTVAFGVGALAAYWWSPRELPDVIYSLGLAIMLVASVLTPGPVSESTGVPLYAMYAGLALGLAATLTKLEQGTFGDRA